MPQQSGQPGQGRRRPSTSPFRAEATIESLVTIVMPDMAATFTPMVYAVPVQLLAYHTAVIMGTDVDQPRNLAKSVTVDKGASGVSRSSKVC